MRVRGDRTYISRNGAVFHPKRMAIIPGRMLTGTPMVFCESENGLDQWFDQETGKWSLGVSESELDLVKEI